MLRSVIAAGEMDQIDRADDVTMPTMIEESHQNGTLSVSTM
jgi:hypothetical protein